MSAKKALLIDLAGTADDFAALAYAAGCGSFALAGLTVYGRGADEVRRMAAALGLGCEVASGAVQPLLQGEPGAVCAPAPALPFTQKAPAAQHSAAETILRAARKAEGGLTILTLGPLTNLALALLQDSALAKQAAAIVVRGGALLAGDCTPAAERNFAADSEAAELVLRSGAPLHICPLDAALPVQLAPDTLPETPVGKYLARTLAGRPLPGLTAAVYAAQPDGFTTDESFAAVETRGSITRGKLVQDCFSDKQYDKNARMILGADRAAVPAALRDALKALAAAR